MIKHLESGLNIDHVMAELEANPKLWNAYTMRTKYANTPHLAVSDIWVRFNAWNNYQGDPVAFNEMHDSVWYGDLPAIRNLCFDVMRRVRGERLGGVLITKIPPGGSVAPHKDQSWHADYYTKYAVQLKGNLKQSFCFETSQLSPLPGDLYTFDNSKLHWVTNESDEDRITLIICVKPETL